VEAEERRTEAGTARAIAFQLDATRRAAPRQRPVVAGERRALHLEENRRP
jgi:hypothetical protein